MLGIGCLSSAMGGIAASIAPVSSSRVFPRSLYISTAAIDSSGVVASDDASHPGDASMAHTPSTTKGLPVSITVPIVLALVASSPSGFVVAHPPATPLGISGHYFRNRHTPRSMSNAFLTASYLTPLRNMCK